MWPGLPRKFGATLTIYTALVTGREHLFKKYSQIEYLDKQIMLNEIKRTAVAASLLFFVLAGVLTILKN